MACVLCFLSKKIILQSYLVREKGYRAVPEMVQNNYGKQTAVSIFFNLSDIYFLPALISPLVVGKLSCSGSWAPSSGIAI